VGNSEDRKYLCHIIEQQEMRPIPASGYREALQLIATFGAAAVLCDEGFQWQDLLGYTAYQVDSPRLILIANEPRQSLWAEALSLGAFDVVTKPFSEREVSFAIASSAPARPRGVRTEQGAISSRAKTA